MITSENIFKNYPDILSTKQMQEMLGIGNVGLYICKDFYWFKQSIQPYAQ